MELTVIARLDAARTIASRAESVINGCTDDELYEMPRPDTRTKSVGRMQICVATSCAEIPRTPEVEQPLVRATVPTVCARADEAQRTTANANTTGLIVDQHNRITAARQRSHFAPWDAKLPGRAPIPDPLARHGSHTFMQNASSMTSRGSAVRG